MAAMSEEAESGPRYGWSGALLHRTMQDVVLTPEVVVEALEEQLEIQCGPID